MKVSKKVEFWDWLYSSGNQSLNKEVFDLLKTDFVYKNKEIESELNGEKNKWNFESVLIDIPINKGYSICSLLQLNGKDEFQENLYLKKNDDYYCLGWIDCHSYEMVFRFVEFYQLMDFLKNSLPEKSQCNTYFLFLARFVALTNEKSANQLIKDAIKCYSDLLDINKNILYKIFKSNDYGNTVYGTDWIIKTKNILTINHPLRFTIHENVFWEKSADNIYNLEGFGAHSIRNKHFNKGMEKPMDIYNVEIDLSEYKFPYDIWDHLMRITT